MRVFFLVALIVLISCTRGDKKKNLLNISLPTEVSSLDPANCYDAGCYVPVTQVYESLYEFEYLKRPYTLRPLLAEGMPSVSNDHLKYTIKIKNGIKYHQSKLIPDGREVKAQDFITQMKRLAFQGTRSQGWWLLDGKVRGINEWRTKVGTNLELFFKEEIPGIYATDDHTLVIELVRPYPQLLYGLAMSLTAPVPEEAVRASHNDLSLMAIGTGAYYITRYNPAQEVVLKKNEHYITSTYPGQGDRFAHERDLLKDAYAKLPFVENIRIVVIKETQTEWLNFMKNKIDMITLTSNYHLALTQDGKVLPEIVERKINLQATPTLSYWWLSFNMKDPVIGKNLNLRKAIAFGIDIDKYIALFTYHMGQKANSIYPPGIFGYSPSSDLPYKFDVKLAKEYLKKAGFPGGKGLPTLKFDIRGTDTRRRQMGEYIQQELRAIGINVEVRQNTFPAFLEKARKGELQFWQGGWIMDYPDAENVLQLLITANLSPGPNTAQYSNPEFDKLFLKLREMEDGPEKKKLMREMEEMVNRDLPWIMQYYSRNYTLYHSYLKNFRYSDIIFNNLKYLKLGSK